MILTIKNVVIQTIPITRVILIIRILTVTLIILRRQEVQVLRNRVKRRSKT